MKNSTMSHKLSNRLMHKLGKAATEARTRVSNYTPGQKKALLVEAKKLMPKPVEAKWLEDMRFE